MGTRFVSTQPHRRLPLALAGIIGLGMALLLAAPARAGAECDITIEPSTIAAGGSFVVSGNFGAGAEVHVVPGEDAAFPEDSEPVYTVPLDRSSFSATITMGADTEGTWTVWGFIFATECGDSAILTVTGTVPDTAMADGLSTGWPLLLGLGSLLLFLALVGASRSVVMTRRT